MSDIIDLEFYRKFRVILPIHSKNKKKSPDGTTKVYRRRRKVAPKTSPAAKNTRTR